jgi:hypothetical protein
VKAEDREEWSRIVEQTKTHPGLYSRQKKKFLGYARRNEFYKLSVGNHEET